MMALRAPLAAIVVLAGFCLAGSAEANGRAGPAAPLASDGGALWRGASGLATEAARYIGSGKFTRLPGAWCADAVSAWLTATGHPPLANRMAASALTYGPHVVPRPGALAVLGHNGRAYHVGVVAGVESNGSIDLISGNWSHRVSRATLPRSAFLAFIGT